MIFDLISIVEQSVANGSLKGALSCPPLPENVKDLELPMTKTKHQPVVWLPPFSPLSLTAVSLSLSLVGEGVAGGSSRVIWSSTDPSHH